MNSASPRPQLLIFDVMETLITEPFWDDMPRHFGMTLDEMLAAKHPTAWVEFEEGRIDETEYLSRFFLDGRRIDRDALHDCLLASYEWLEGVPELLAELQSQGTRMVGLSNYSDWYRLIEAKLNLSRYVGWDFVSCRTGLRKPNPRAYLNVAESLGVERAACLFIDDRPVNVEAALDVGMDAILRRDLDDLRRQLARRGVLPAD